MANNPNNKKNLRPFKPGQSGNPKGRPKLPDLSAELAELLGSEQNQTTAARLLLNSLYVRAVKKGDTRAAELLLDRAYGKVTQGLHVTGKEEPTIVQVEIIKTVRHDAPSTGADTASETKGFDEP